MTLDSVKEYLSSKDKKAYFVFVDNDRYSTVLDEFNSLGVKAIRISDYCKDSDKMPNIDNFFTDLKKLDSAEKYIVLGFGEYLALKGYNYARQQLLKLKDTIIGHSKVVFLLRELPRTIIKCLASDPRFDALRYCVLSGENINSTITVSSIKKQKSSIGIKNLLARLENGQTGNFIVKTNVKFPNPILQIKSFSCAYEEISYMIKGFELTSSNGSSDQWETLLEDINKSNKSFDKLFEKYNFNTNIDSDFYRKISGQNYESWLYYIYLKVNSTLVSNKYLDYVLSKTNSFDEFISNCLNAITDIELGNKEYWNLYEHRKTLIKDFPEPLIADFLIYNKKIEKKSIYRLTNNTLSECEEIVAWISKYGFIPEIKHIYPELNAYLKKYFFKNIEFADEITNYFDEYKQQKISNVIDQEFLKIVEKFAFLRPYNQLPTREQLIENINPQESYLYWLDALGVEYLSLIEFLAKQNGLNLKVNIARAQLPTITSMNKNFFDNWQGAKQKDSNLDETKHKDSSKYNFTLNELPIHLASEISIISKAISRAAVELRNRKYKRFILTSDHGASRLAVLRKKEEKYETNTKGKHSGRCCEIFENYDIPFAAEENGYLVLADYGRFKGSRAANVEVHGGASLEEVIIPIIEFSLNNASINIEVITEQIVVDFSLGFKITLYSNTPLHDSRLILNGKSYEAIYKDEHHFDVNFYDVKRAGTYSVDVYTGDNLITTLQLNVISKSAKINDEFDNLF